MSMSTETPVSIPVSKSSSASNDMEATQMASSTTNPMKKSDASNDLDLDNIIYVQNIPAVSADAKVALSEHEESINLWLAWELTRVEEQVNDKITSMQLPNDDSVDAMSKRTAYRSKVVNFYRGQSPW